MDNNATHLVRRTLATLRHSQHALELAHRQGRLPAAQYHRIAISTDRAIADHEEMLVALDPPPPIARLERA